MTWLIGLAVCLVVFGALMWGARKAGKDAVRAKSAKESLDEIRKANAPFSDPDLQRVRERWRRD